MKKNNNTNENKPKDKLERLGKYCSLCPGYLPYGVDLKWHMDHEHDQSEVDKFLE